MPVRIIYGPSGSGKTHLLYKKIIEQAVSKPEQKFIFIVPEQSSLQAQKKVVKMHPNHGVFNIDVLTFGRLGYRVFEELGMELNETIDDTGKNLIVRKVIDDIRYELKIIKAGRRQGFISEMKSMISEFKQYGITPERLNEIIEGTTNDRLKDKLTDLGRIYTGFEKYIEGRFVTVEDKPEILYREIDRSKAVDGAVVIFDGFTGFTPVQYRLIEKIALKAKEVIFTATLSDDTEYNVISGAEELFYMSKDMIKKLGDIADRQGTEFIVEKQVKDTELFRFNKSSELDFVEKNIFRYNRDIFEGNVSDISVIRLSGFAEEVKYAAAAILKEIRNNNYRFNDIALVMGDMDMYADEIARVFDESGIPFFMDHKRSLIGNPLVEYIRGMLEIASTDYSYESVFRVLKNGLCDIDKGKVDLFENYIIEFGIRGEKRYSDKFVREYRGKHIGLDTVNEIRQALLNKTGAFLDSMLRGDRKVKTYVRAVYDFMEKENVYDALNKMADEILDEAKAEEFRKSYGHVITLLDRIYELLGDEEVTVREFVEILDAGFEEIKVGLIPPSSDCVTIGDLERTRLDDIKVLIVLGANEGIIPKTSDNHGILSEEERRNLSERDIVLSPSPRDKVFIQKYYLYLNLTKPSEKLYITYHCYGSDGKETKASRIVSMFTHMFPSLKICDSRDIGVIDLLTNRDNSMHILADYKKFHKKDSGFTAFAANMLSDAVYRDRINAIISMINVIFTDDNLSEKAAKIIYEDYVSSSITRIESYASCAFKHFACYGLGLEERKEYELNDMDIGIVFHKVLELIGLELEKNNLNYSDLSDEDRHGITISMVDKATVDFKDSYFNDSATNSYMKKRLTQMVERTLWALGEQLKAGDFLPDMFEKKFENNYDGMCITGKVDRVDLAVKDEDTYVKIIDYKSGDNRITREDLLAGTNIQLLVYMKNILDEFKSKTKGNVFAAAALYNKIFNPILEDKGDNNLLKAYRPSGVIGHESIELLDRDFEKESYVIPVKNNKDGVVAFSETVVSDEQFKLMADYATEKMVGMIGEIKSGTAKVNPYEKSCDYCPYNGLCGFNSVHHDEYRKKPQPDKELFWQRIGWEAGKDGVD